LEEGKYVKVVGWEGKDAAKIRISEAIRRSSPSKTDIASTPSTATSNRYKIRLILSAQLYKIFLLTRFPDTIGRQSSTKWLA
jgi:hypothetical protein